MTGANPARAAGGRRALIGFLGRWALLAVLLLIWELAARQAASVFFPPPTTIFAGLWRTWFGGDVTHLFLSRTAIENMLPSLGRMLGGWAVASVVGVVLGVVLGRSRTAMEYAAPILTFFRAVPPPALVPVFIVLFDLGGQMQFVTIVFGVVWPVLLNTVDGARSVNDTQLATARVFQVPRAQWLFGVVLPAATQKIFAGLRLSLSLSLVLMVVSELVGATDGIGVVLSQARSAFDYTTLWTVVVLLGILGYLFNAVLMKIERRAMSWQPQAAVARGSGA